MLTDTCMYSHRRRWTHTGYSQRATAGWQVPIELLLRFQFATMNTRLRIERQYLGPYVFCVYAYGCGAVRASPAAAGGASIM